MNAADNFQSFGPICRTCVFYVAPLDAHIPPDADEKGECRWIPPPMISRMISIGDAEPNTRIGWSKSMEHPLVTYARGTCGVHRERGP